MDFSHFHAFKQPRQLPRPVPGSKEVQTPAQMLASQHLQISLTQVMILSKELLRFISSLGMFVVSAPPRECPRDEFVSVPKRV